MSMTCNEASQMISRLADGELSPSETEALNRHLASCASCRRESDLTHKLDAALRDMPVPSIPLGMAERLRHGIAERTEEHEKRNVSPAFRVLAIAATLLFAVTILFLSVELRQARLKAAILSSRVSILEEGATSQAQPKHEIPIVPTEHAAVQQLQVFRASREYLNGQLRWMVTDGDVVETGMSSSPTMQTDFSDDKETIVLNLQYIECAQDKKPNLLSSPEFVFFSGDEVSVRLKGRSDAEPVLRYRVRGERLIDGSIRAEIDFTDELHEPNKVNSAISTKVNLTPGKPVLLGAGGDGDCRWELYAWGVARPIGYKATAHNSSPL